MTNMSRLPKISFGIIVLNGEPFTRYCLRALYPFAHEIIVVEGASRNAAALSTPDGHSIDGTLGTLHEFKLEEDPANKVQVVTRDGFWTEKDEQSQAYATRATGDYLWQVDIDEFYSDSTMHRVCDLLLQDANLAMISFPVKTFWGGFDYLTDGFREQEFTIRERGWPRLFRWGKGYHYLTHRPPTVCDASGTDLRHKYWLDRRAASRLGLELLHYSLVFPHQVDAKTIYHGAITPSTLPSREKWAKNFRSLAHPFQVASDGSVRYDISWLERFTGVHPQAIEEMRSDIQTGRTRVQLRQVQDIERLLQSRSYRLVCQALKHLVPGLARARIQMGRASRLLGRVVKGGEVFLTGTLPTYLRLMLAQNDYSSDLYSLRSIADSARSDRDAFAKAFFAWDGEEIRPRLRHHAVGRWATLIPEPELPDVPGRAEQSGAALLVAAKAFFQEQSPESGRVKLNVALEQLLLTGKLLIYAPHPQVFSSVPDYHWCPSWQELTDWARGRGAHVVEFNPAYDRNGFFYIVLAKGEAEQTCLVGPEALKKYRFHFFYLQQGGSRVTSHSAKVLSAAAYRVLQRYGTLVSEYSFLETIDAVSDLRPGDICMGHFGPWIVDAKRAGCHIILYGPSDRFQKERTDLFHGEPFYLRLQARGNFDAQYAASDMGVFQGGARWRSEDMWTYRGLCRWVDLPVSPVVFPRTKRQFASPGKRKFVFINLWDENQKGAETAERIVQACPDFEFIAIAGQPIRQPNCRNYPWVGSTTPRYRHILCQADFVVCPGREDPQPGTVAEACSLGLLPILSYGSGYVLSFPQRIDVDDIPQCVSVLRAAQQASDQEIRLWQRVAARYLESFHRPAYFESMMLYYLRELVTEIEIRQM